MAKGPFPKFFANSVKSHQGEFVFERDINNAGLAFDFLPLNRSPMAAV